VVSSGDPAVVDCMPVNRRSLCAPEKSLTIELPLLLPLPREWLREIVYMEVAGIKSFMRKPSVKLVALTREISSFAVEHAADIPAPDASPQLELEPDEFSYCTCSAKFTQVVSL
jgi:hypothetical protein